MGRKEALIKGRIQSKTKRGERSEDHKVKGGNFGTKWEEDTGAGPGPESK